jgi:hypothetical protein
MTITTLTCEKCGEKLKIETDDTSYREKKKAAFEKKHGKCKERKNKK